MDTIINQLISNFDFTLMLVINVATYLIIKILDEVNGDKTPTTWQKRIVFLIVTVAAALIYKFVAHESAIIIINSCILAPVAWSWLWKPIANKLGIDYKTTDN